MIFGAGEPLPLEEAAPPAPVDASVTAPPQERRLVTERTRLEIPPQERRLVWENSSQTERSPQQMVPPQEWRLVVSEEVSRLVSWATRGAS